MHLNHITKEHIGKEVTTEAEVINVIQTKGPTLFKVSDGHGTFTLKAFSGAGKRSFPNTDVGGVAKFTFYVTEHDGVIEGEVKQCENLANMKEALERIEKIRKEKSEVKDANFLVPSASTEKLKEQFKAAARYIKQAIMNNRTILIRHHNDCDGYSSGVALQRAIMPMLERIHGKKDASRYLTRSPCRSPFYSYEDSLRDISIAASNLSRYDEEPPLVLILDNGSGEEDLMGIKQGKVYGLDFIVVDHHPYGEKDVISSEVLVHINPHLVGEDYHFTAGMLCVELAHIINPDAQNIKFIAAMAGLADRTESPELHAFLALAKTEGYSREQLERMGLVIDFIANQLRNMESKDVVADMFGESKKRQQEMTDLLYPYVIDMYDTNIALAKTYGVKDKIGDCVVQFLDVEGIFSRSQYPPAGKTTGLFHDLAVKDNAKVVTFGYGSDFLTIRATNDAPFMLHEVLARIKQELPNAFAEGGGHQKAGSIKFAPKAKEEMLAFMRKVIAEKY